MVHKDAYGVVSPQDRLLAPSVQRHRIPQAAWGPLCGGKFWLRDRAHFTFSGEKLRSQLPEILPSSAISYELDPEVVLIGFSVMLRVLRSVRRCLTLQRSGRGAYAPGFVLHFWPRR